MPADALWKRGERSHWEQMLLWLVLACLRVSPKLVMWVQGSVHYLFLLPSHQQSDCLAPLLGHRASSICISQAQGTTLFLASVVSSDKCCPSVSSGLSRRTREERHRLPAPGVPTWGGSRLSLLGSVPGAERPALPGERGSSQAELLGFYSPPSGTVLETAGGSWRDQILA